MQHGDQTWLALFGRIVGGEWALARSGPLMPANTTNQIHFAVAGGDDAALTEAGGAEDGTRAKEDGRFGWTFDWIHGGTRGSARLLNTVEVAQNSTGGLMR